VPNLELIEEPIRYSSFVILSAFVIRISSLFRASNLRPSTNVNDLHGAVRQPVKNPGFTVHPPQCRLLDRAQFLQCRFGKPGHSRQYCSGGRALAVLALSLGLGAGATLFGAAKEQAGRETPVAERSFSSPPFSIQQEGKAAWLV